MNVDSATGQGGSTAVDRQPPLVTSPDPPPVQSPTGGDQGVASPTESHPTASLSGKEQVLHIDLAFWKKYFTTLGDNLLNRTS